MEISLVSAKVLKIKGKKTTFLVNPTEKLSEINAALYFHEILSYEGDIVKIAGAGDFEVGGVKVVGYRSEESVIYSMGIDGVDLLIGECKALERMQHKVKEHMVLVVKADEVVDCSFATSLGVNAVLFYGEKASEVVHGLAKENVMETNKFQTTLDKLPAEMQTILLK